MKRQMLISSLSVLTIAGAAIAASQDAPYPDGYRKWQHVKSMVIQEGHPLHGAFGGIHHLYANSKAMEGYRTGQFPKGAVIVFDLLEAPAADHAITEGKRKVLGVMYKDEKKFSATGGWGFEAFVADSKSERAVGANAATKCFGCHTAQKQAGYVFSAYRP